MRALTFVVLFVSASAACSQSLPPRPLQLPKYDRPSSSGPADQLAACRAQADTGDPNAIFDLGFFYLIGQGVAQDAATAELYFKKVELTPAQMCVVAETYIETSLKGRVDAAMRWANAANSGCTDWAQASWYGSNSLGPNTQKEVEFLRKGLEIPKNAYRAASQRQLGELILTGTTIGASQSEETEWIGEAARQRLGQAENAVGRFYNQHPQETAGPEVSLEWTRKASRYGDPTALAVLGEAIMTRQISDLTYLDGMGLYALGMRQNLLSAASLESQSKQLAPEQREELNNSVAKWERVRQETGSYYTENDPMRLTATPDEAQLVHDATPSNPDAELRLAFALEHKSQLARAEALYRSVWQNGPAQIWVRLAVEAAKSEKWSVARELYTRAADVGSRPACAALAHIDGEGLAGKQDPLSAYLWTLRSGQHDQTELQKRRKAVNAADIKTVQLTQARWIVARKDYWRSDVKAAQAILDAQLVTEVNSSGFQAQKQPVVSIEELRFKASAGDSDAAYDLAVRLLWNNAAIRNTNEIEHYASLGAKTAEQKSHIADGYARSENLDAATSRKYAEKWWQLVGGSQAYYSLGKLYNGKSDGTVATEDEKKAVAFWEQSVSAGNERWARLARMELGYRVIKGWTSGDLAKDANWAHELAMEFLCKEFYEVAGEYSYGKELQHNPQIYELLVERAAIYNSDNAQSQLAHAILTGEWKRQDQIDAFAWVKLHGVKQDTGESKQLEVDAQDPGLRQKIKERYSLFLKTRAESGAFYPQDDPLRTATAETLEPRATLLDPEAQFRLGTLLEQQATQDSLKRAVGLYSLIWATAGREVRLTWGRTLMNGSPDVPADEIGAEKWLWDAANAGSHEACEDLAVIYKEGRGVQADPVAAESWTELADHNAKASAALTEPQRRELESKLSDWLSKHPNW